MKEMHLKGWSVLVFFFLNTPAAITQQIDPCAFDQINRTSQMHAAEQKIQAKIQEMKTNHAPHQRNADAIRTIPVVVHVIHTGWTENISDAQIRSQIQILNEDFGKFPGSNGDGAGVDTRVRFCLAQISPDGHCTNGIVRIRSTLTDHKTFERSLLKELSFWDPSRYLNIYVVKYINGGILGYSSFPGGPPDEDGCVMKHNVFGNIGTALTSLGRTASHEFGHWFGLYHTFNNGCGIDVCTDGDYVCDTPPQASPSYTCALFNTCSNDDPNVSDLRENYMNYTPDACKNMFTPGQKERMHAMLDTIRQYIWSEANLISTGCDSGYMPPAQCPVVADLVTLTRKICFGNEIRFMDISLNDATIWKWSFPGGIPSASNDENPLVVYPDTGTYPVKLIVSNATSSDSVTFDKYVTVTSPGIGDPLNYSEDLNSGMFPPLGITIFNPDEGITWELDSLAYTSAPSSIRINNLINTNYGSKDEIILPYFDLTSATAEADISMRFNWAYAKSDPSFSDELIVLLSTDCGSTYSQIFNKTQAALATGPTQTTPFVPDSTQWRSAEINLNTYRNESYVQIKFVNVTDGGNNLYIDDIAVAYIDVMTKVEDLNNRFSQMKIYPNPTVNELTLDDGHHDLSNSVIEIYDSWGRKVTTKKMTANVPLLKFDVGDFTPGLYMISVLDLNGHIRTGKFVKID